MAHENRLARETSPYLLQHKGNPVDWYPWGEEAFAKAKSEDKPILLSVGYSACHWCHVMERESFENPEIARLMNEWFVSIKVDREERPDVDHLYMQAVQSMTGQGGWPMTVFLAPDGVPFYGGTYFPPEDRHGIPGFPKVLRAIADVYRNRRGDALETGRQLVEQLRQGERIRAGQDLLTEDLLHSAAATLGQAFDTRYGGVGGAPKFPQPMLFDFLLRYWHRTGRDRVLDMVTVTLTRMARGGIYDQLGGGFHRYSVDERWLVPHFEKMLYDNAQLARLYLDAWLVTGDAEYRRIAEETLDYVLREMTHPAGGFYSAQDADSEGEEGKFFLWSREEIEGALGQSDEARAACRYWGVDAGPNFEGRNILFVPQDLPGVAEELGVISEGLSGLLARARRRLLEVRQARIKPGRDEKVLAGWNGLMLRAFAEAARSLGRPDFERAAIRSAEFLLTAMRRDGRLLRSWKDGEVRLLGYLEDYAMVADGLLALYQATLDRRWLDEARGLTEELVRLFWDPKVEGFFDTGQDHEALVARPRNLFDNAIPSGSSVATDVLLRLAVFTGDDAFEKKAVTALRSMSPLLGRYASGFGRWLSALDFSLGPRAEVALVWPAGGERGPGPFLSEIFRHYEPRAVIAGAADGDSARGIPLLEGKRSVGGKTTAYLCERYACQAPTTDPAELRSQLAALHARAN